MSLRHVLLLVVFCVSVLTVTSLLPLSVASCRYEPFLLPCYCLLYFISVIRQCLSIMCCAWLGETRCAMFSAAPSRWPCLALLFTHYFFSHPCLPGHLCSVHPPMKLLLMQAVNAGERDRNLHRLCPSYLADMLVSRSTIESQTSLLSSACGDFDVPQTRLQVGKWVFSVAGPAAWNDLPIHVQTSEIHVGLVVSLQIFSTYSWSTSVTDCCK